MFDGSCEACIFGCNDSNAINYDESVIHLWRFLYLCCLWMFKSTYLEYNPSANIDSDPSDCVNLSIAVVLTLFSKLYMIANVDDGSYIASILGCTIRVCHVLI